MTNVNEAAILVGIDAPLEIKTLRLPALTRGQVLVDIAWSALCHTQLNEIRGLKGPDPYLPHTLGHEGAGIVTAVGPGVGKVVPGDRVVLTWIVGTGLDGGPVTYQCGSGTINSGPVSTFMRQAIVSENRLVKLGSQMPLREAALFGCALPTGFGMVRNDAALRAGGSIGVFGVGGIGLAAILGAVIAKASVIVAVDLNDNKLQQATKLGATHTINAQAENVLDRIGAITDGKGLDAAVEASGAPAAMETAFDAIRRGGTAVIAGNAPNGAKIRIDPMSLIQGKRITGSWGGGSVPDRDIAHYEKLHDSGHLLLGDIITHEFSLNEINEAFATLASGNAGRILIDMTRIDAPVRQVKPHD